MPTTARLRGTHGARARLVAAAITGLAVLGTAACAHPVTGTGTPADTVAPDSSAPTTVAPPTSTVYVTAPETVTVPRPPAKPLTPCQRLRADGHSYDIAYAAWVEAGFPPNWDADHDGLPCEQSYGEQN